MSTTTTAVRPLASLPLVVVGGGLLVAVFDAVFACTWWAVAADVGPMRILQSIGAGLLGEASFAGGWRSAAIGAAAHGFIAICMVGAYAFAALRLPVLVRQPLRYGAAYGLFLYGFPVQQSLVAAFPEITPLALLPTAAACALVLAAASWHWVERPAMQWKGKRIVEALPAV